MMTTGLMVRNVFMNILYTGNDAWNKTALLSQTSPSTSIMFPNGSTDIPIVHCGNMGCGKRPLGRQEGCHPINNRANRKNRFFQCQRCMNAQDAARKVFENKDEDHVDDATAIVFYD